MTINNLPTELLLLIFENLNYWDLRLRVPFVCHRFRDVLAKRKSDVGGAPIDRLLFRDSVISSTKLGDLPIAEYKIHPIFLQGIDENPLCQMDYMTTEQREDRIQDPRFFRSHLYNRSFEYTRYSEIPPLNENFVSPAVDKISFVYDSEAFQDHLEIDNNGKPICVGEMVEAMVKDFMYGYMGGRKVVALWKSEEDDDDDDDDDEGPGRTGSDAILGLQDKTRNNCDIFYMEIQGFEEGGLRLRYIMPKKRIRRNMKRDFQG